MVHRRTVDYFERILVTREKVSAELLGRHEFVRSIYDAIQSDFFKTSTEDKAIHYDRYGQATGTLLLPNRSNYLTEMQILSFWENAIVGDELEPGYGTVFYVGAKKDQMGKVVGHGFEFSSGRTYDRMARMAQPPYYSIERIGDEKPAIFEDKPHKFMHRREGKQYISDKPEHRHSSE